MKIKNSIIREVFDSRATSTIEIELRDQNNRLFRSSVPSGKSTGKNEAQVFDFKNASSALEKIIQKGLYAQSFDSVRALDDFLLKLDGTKNKSGLGGNTLLGISIAYARAFAFERNIELWQLLRNEFFSAAVPDEKAPMIFSNLINGGAHAGNNLDIQEYMVVVKSEGDLKENIKQLIVFYKNLGKFLQTNKKVKKAVIGDEGGYAIDFKDNFEPIQILEKLILKEKLGSCFSIGLDVAANNFQSGSEYRFDGKKMSREKLAGIYQAFLKKSKLLRSLEDPFGEEDVAGFQILKKDSGNILMIGDDLTTTNGSMIACYAGNAINGVIIKPNQIGTLTETCEAMLAAKKNNVKTIVSHRSGETEDNFLIQIAKAGYADGVKIGAPIRERIYKFNELLRLYY